MRNEYMLKYCNPAIWTKTIPSNFKGESAILDLKEFFPATNRDHGMNSFYHRMADKGRVGETMWDEMCGWDFSDDLYNEGLVDMLETPAVREFVGGGMHGMYLENLIEAIKNETLTDHQKALVNELTSSLTQSVRDHQMHGTESYHYDKMFDHIADMVDNLSASYAEFICWEGTKQVVCEHYEAESVRIYYTKKRLRFVAKDVGYRVKWVKKVRMEGYVCLADDHTYDDTDDWDYWLEDCLSEICDQSIEPCWGNTDPYISTSIEDIANGDYFLGTDGAYELKKYCEMQAAFAAQCKRLGF